MFTIIIILIIIIFKYHKNFINVNKINQYQKQNLTKAIVNWHKCLDCLQTTKPFINAFEKMISRPDLYEYNEKFRKAFKSIMGFYNSQESI